MARLGLRPYYSHVEQPVSPSKSQLRAIAVIDTLKRVSVLIQNSLDLLDAADAPADIAAHLDLALSRIDELLGSPERQIAAAIELASK